MREIIVPPEKRVLNVEVTPSAEKYKPGEKAKVKVKLTDPTASRSSARRSSRIYDKAVEYISGGSNVPEIKAFFWKWRRQHHPQHREQPATHSGYNLVRPEWPSRCSSWASSAQSVADEDESGEDGGRQAAMTDAAAAAMSAGNEALARSARWRQWHATPRRQRRRGADGRPRPMMAMAKSAEETMKDESGRPAAAKPRRWSQPTVRTNFADTALWVALR